MQNIKLKKWVEKQDRKFLPFRGGKCSKEQIKLVQDILSGLFLIPSMGLVWIFLEQPISVVDFLIKFSIMAKSF